MCVCVSSNNNNNNDGIGDGEAAYLLKLRDNLSPLGSYWLNNISKCDWIGVQCSSLDSNNSRYIQGIDLSSKGLTGTIPSGLNHSLFKLTYLNLAHNFLTGPLPSLAITSLQYVDLSLNNFNSIPHGFFQALSYVEDLALANNTNLPPWTFPANFVSSSVQSLDLSATNLVGSLPYTFHSFPDLINLDLSGNNLTGMLSESFAKLLQVYLSNPKDNKLSGTIQVLSSITQLYDVNLEGNSLEGSIPDLSNCTNLRFLVLAYNRLTGVVPVSLVQNNKQIWQVSLENNWLQGPLPLFNKTRTHSVSLGGNGFCLDHSGPCDYRVTTLLQVAEAFGYPFLLAKSWRGNNPCQGWDFITCDNNGNIRTVNLTNLNLMGTISPAFQNLTDLYELYLGGNKLSGSIPESLTTLQHLKILDVSNNNLSGNIPPFSNKMKLITAGNALLRQSHSQANSPSKSPLSPPSIVGILIGGVGVAVVFVAIVYNHRRRLNLVKRDKEDIYKATLNDGRQVATKVLKESKGSVEEFVNEVVIIVEHLM
ncbi:hypothetical protein PIB30_036610 [Stylosanthes scabra]|uniref:Leucine-rich repeat-containing N-terminal plant-type domain-containing protein n=1 Tax=Stylosanthes scabra TaxID=79078 RepID=A0ABU6RDJ2_9FABA|nr:hypothetical protein [Stylosanthes scabra]